MIQNHKCAYLRDGFICGGEEYCQYELVAVADPNGPVFCGKDQILEMRRKEE